MKREQDLHDRGEKGFLAALRSEDEMTMMHGKSHALADSGLSVFISEQASILVLHYFLPFFFFFFVFAPAITSSSYVKSVTCAVRIHMHAHNKKRDLERERARKRGLN